MEIYFLMVLTDENIPDSFSVMDIITASTDEKALNYKNTKQNEVEFEITLVKVIR